MDCRSTSKVRDLGTSVLTRRPTAARGTIALIAAAVCGLPWAGCGPGGPPLGRVEGIVTLDGQPIQHATVEFQPTQGAPSYGGTDADGRYELQYSLQRKGALVGKHTVRITTAGEITNEDDITVNVPETIPPWYHRHSTLEVEVERGSNRHDFALSTKPPEAGHPGERVPVRYAQRARRPDR